MGRSWAKFLLQIAVGKQPPRAGCGRDAGRRHLMRLTQATGAVCGSVRAPRCERAGGGLLHLEGWRSHLLECWADCGARSGCGESLAIDVEMCRRTSDEMATAARLETLSLI